MAITITTAMPTTFKVELLKGLHNFTAGSTRFKMALFTATASGSGTYGAATTNYSDMGSDELPTATGYTRPGELPYVCYTYFGWNHGNFKLCQRNVGISLLLLLAVV